MSDTILFERIDGLVEDCSGAVGDWGDVVRRAQARPELVPWLRRPHKRLLLAAAILISLIVILFATPAFGLLKNWIGRKDVSFKGKQAPYEVRKDFGYLSTSMPGGWQPEAILSRTKRVTTVRAFGEEYVLYVAPTREGGFCWGYTHAIGDGCVVDRAQYERLLAEPGAAESGSVNQQLLAVGIGAGGRHAYVSGAVLAPNVASLTIEYEDHTSARVPFVYVSKPIDACFFFFGRPPGHRDVGTRMASVSAWDSHGKLIAKMPLPLLPSKRLRPSKRSPSPKPKPTPKPVPTPKPTSPLQRARKDGAVIVAGKNGVATINASNASPRVKSLIGPHGADWTCFSFMPYHEVDPFGMGASISPAGRGRLPAGGIRTPFDGCEVEGIWRQKWPDRIHSHAIVEIAFTARARKYFADHAAAGDLDLFVRLLRSTRIRSLSGPALDRKIASRFGNAVTHLRSISGSLPPDHLGYIDLPGGAEYVERSTTGRLFQMKLENGKIGAQNVRPLVD